MFQGTTILAVCHGGRVVVVGGRAGEPGTNRVEAQCEEGT